MQRHDQNATGPATQAVTAGQWEREPTEASDGPGAAIGASGGKGRLNFLSTHVSTAECGAGKEVG